MSLTSELTPADIAAVTGGNRNNGMGWGGDSLLYLIILFLIVVCGLANGGFSGFSGGGQNGYDTRADIQRGFDNQAVISKLDGITHGICDSTYAMNNTITSGFSSAELSRCNQQAALMQQLNNMAAQAQASFCETQRITERGFSDTNYNIATQSRDTQNTVQNSTRDIIENQNSNSRAILDFLTQDKISTLQSENQALRLAASQSNQNAVLMAAMDANKAEILRRTGNDCPIPAYVVPNPNCCYGNPVGVSYGGGCNSGCGC